MVRSGAAYVAGLRDAREVWLAGERIVDVTTHPALAEPIQSIAHLYDLQHDPELRGSLTYTTDGAEPSFGMAFLVPREPADVSRRGRAFTLWANATGGMMGRSPDFLNSVVTAFASSSEFFGRGGASFADNITRYYEDCRARDLCLTHTITDPMVDRSRSAGDQDDPHTVLGVVRQDRKGITVRGAKLLGTLAPYADELLVYPLNPLRAGEERHALAFAVPIATPGLKLICRESFAAGRDMVDHPLATRFDEMDAAAVFDDVFVPWERVFLHGDVNLANTLRAGTSMMAFAAHQATARAVAKAEFVFGIATLVAEAIGRDKLPDTQEKLGEMVSYVQLERACVRAAEADASQDASGVFLPALDPLLASMTMFSRIYPRMIELLQLVGSSGLIMTPLASDLRGPIAEDIQRYFRGAHVGADERVRRFRVAADLALEAFGQRQVLYERFYAGEPGHLLMRNFARFERTDLMDRVHRFLDGNPASEPVAGVV